MRQTRSISNRRGRKRLNHTFELQLTSMLDVLVIILVFLLKSYTTSTHQFNSAKGLEMPYSRSSEMPVDALSVLLTQDGILFENAQVLQFDKVGNSMVLKRSDLSDNNLKIQPLYDALIKSRTKAEALRAKSQARDTNGNPLPFDGVLAIQSDKKIPYEIVKKVMYTAGVAEFKTFRFLAMKKE